MLHVVYKWHRAGFLDSNMTVAQNGWNTKSLILNWSPKFFSHGHMMLMFPPKPESKLWVQSSDSIQIPHIAMCNSHMYIFGTCRLWLPIGCGVGSIWIEFSVKKIPSCSSQKKGGECKHRKKCIFFNKRKGICNNYTRWWQLNFFYVHPEPWGNDLLDYCNIFQIGSTTNYVTTISKSRLRISTSSSQRSPNKNSAQRKRSKQ